MRTIKTMLERVKKKMYAYFHPSVFDALNAFGIMEDWGDDLTLEKIAELRKKMEEL